MSDPTVLWSSPVWLEDATLSTSGWRSRGPGARAPSSSSHLRPWATTLRVPTADGAVWLKAAAPRTRFEIALYGLLAREVPEHVLVPLAVDVARGWVLLPDGGARLG